MKRGKRFTTLAVALALVCGLVIGASAAGTSQQIQAYLTMGRTVKYNGEVQTMKDANGDTVYPISYKGNTYLPIRAIANMLGIGIDWDADTQTVVLGGASAGVNLFETFTPYTPYQSISYAAASRYDGPIFYQKAGAPEDIGGEKVSSWLRLWNGQSNTGKEGNALLASFNLGGKYSTLTFKAYANFDTTLTVKGDNDSVLGEFSLKGGQVPQTFTVDLKDTMQLTFQRALAPAQSGSTSIPVNAIDAYVFDAVLS